MEQLDWASIKKIHCIGIGGIGVSGIAELLLSKGFEVTGSDLVENALTKRLIQLGAKINVGHRAQNIHQPDLVVYSSAVTKDNPEFAKAIELNIPTIVRGKLLSILMAGKTSIAISGTHGKTTTTGLTSYLLRAAKLEPTCVIGGVINGELAPVLCGRGDYFVAETDESDASFLFLSPTIAITTNIDADHLCSYNNNFEQLKKSFITFLNKIPANGLAIVCIDDPVVESILPELTCPFVTVGMHARADVRMTGFSQQGLQTHLQVVFNSGREDLSLQLNLAGQHNAQNALAVVAVAQFLEIDDAVLKNAFANFPGVGRRFKSHGKITLAQGSALLFDDYGHHPREISATLSAARGAWPTQRIVLVFQPHRYSRTQDLLHDFAKVLGQADVLLLLDIYPAGEPAIPGIDAHALCKAITEQGRVNPIFVPQMQQLPQMLRGVLKPDDIVILQGAGSIGTMANILVS